MASAFSHPIVALGLIPWFRRASFPAYIWLLGMACTILPDADVVGFRFGIRYKDMLGHRGFSHSLTFAALLSVFLVALLSRWSGQRFSPLLLFGYFFLCTASHGVLDAMTDGGLGVAFFAPFSPTRYFLPWRPIHVSPLTPSRFFSAQGLVILGTELVWVWVPAFLLGLLGALFQQGVRK